MITLRLFPLIGSGYLHLNDGTKSKAEFNLIMNAVNMTGGGCVFGEEQFIHSAANADAVLLSVGIDKSFFVALGAPSQGTVAVAVLGPAAEESQSCRTDSE